MHQPGAQHIRLLHSTTNKDAAAFYALSSSRSISATSSATSVTALLGDWLSVDFGIFESPMIVAFGVEADELVEVVLLKGLGLGEFIYQLC